MLSKFQVQQHNLHLVKQTDDIFLWTIRLEPAAERHTSGSVDVFGRECQPSVA